MADAPVWLTGVLCLVTGGTTGIGAAISEALSGTGDRVAANLRRSADTWVRISTPPVEGKLVRRLTDLEVGGRRRPLPPPRESSSTNPAKAVFRKYQAGVERRWKARA